jgi:heme-degrading monooxygenase HmoA
MKYLLISCKSSIICSMLLPWGGTFFPGKRVFFSPLQSCLKKGERMPYARIAVYKVKTDSAITVDEAIRRSQTGMLPIFRNQPGFLSYGQVKAGQDSVISISFWQSQQQAEAAVRLSESWAKDNLAGMTESVQNYVGELSFFTSAVPVGA